MSKNIEIKRMTGTMRIVHWVTFFSMITAVITGLYIGHPYYQTFIADPAVINMLWHGIDGLTLLLLLYLM